MQAPRGLTMDDAVAGVKNCTQKIEDAAGRCVDHTFCCGCYEEEMRQYLHQDEGSCFEVDKNERTASGCLCNTLGKQANECPSTCLMGGTAFATLGASFCWDYPLPALVSATPLVPIFYLIKKRFDKVKQEGAHKRQ